MWRYFLKRVALFIPTLVIITLISFAVSRLAPGDPAAAKVGAGSDGSLGGRSTLNEKTIELIRKQWHLDKPIWQQYVIWTGGLMSFKMDSVFTERGTDWSAASFTGRPDFGKSFIDNRPVFDKMIERVPVTLIMNLLAIIIAYSIAVPLGIYSSTHPGTTADRVSTFMLFAMYSLPVFWIGTLALTFLANPEFLSIFPASGLRSPGFSVNWSVGKKLLDYAWHLALPLIVYTYADFAFISRQMRSSMLEVIRQDFIRTARAKGLSERTVIYKHALRNAMMPLVTIAGLQFGNLISGAVLVETVFSWPGLGTLALDAILGRDYPTLLGVLTFSATLVIVANLITDLSYRWIDPRLRGR